MAYDLTYRALCPSQSLSLVCKELISPLVCQRLTPSVIKAMKGFHNPDWSQQAFLTGLAHLYNLIPYQRRAKHAGLCGVEVEGGTVPTRDWLLNLQILTSGGFR
jgi:hypothetical protein